jgi:hypothetical protein
MDKETLSNYGWIVICVMVLAVMIALATPFGSFISVAIKNTTSGLFDVEQKALTSTGLISVPDQKFDGEGDEYFYDKAENTFAICNYYEVTNKCECFGAGGCASWLVEQYENHGYSIEEMQTWSQNLEFLHEHLNEDIEYHLHGNVFAFEYPYTPGMTWGDFINSANNNGDFALDENGNVYCNLAGYNNGHHVAFHNHLCVNKDDVIDSDAYYFIGYTAK